jgi:hypothetical protein
VRRWPCSLRAVGGGQNIEFQSRSDLCNTDDNQSLSNQIGAFSGVKEGHSRLQTINQQVKFVKVKNWTLVYMYLRHQSLSQCYGQPIILFLCIYTMSK